MNLSWALLLTLALSACAPAEQPIVIGWIGPLTGQSAVLGIDGAVAAQIAVDEINRDGGIGGRPVKLIVEDDRYDVAAAVSAYRKLVHADGARIIIANTYGSVFALADEAEKDGVLLMDPLDCNSVIAGLGDHVFCLATDSESIGLALAGHAAGAGAGRVGILHWNSDPFMPLVKDVFVQQFPGETVVEPYAAGTADFRTALLKMGDVDALVFLGYDEIGNAMRQARDMGFTGQFYATGTVTSPGLQEASLGAAEGTVFAFWEAPDSLRAQSFRSAFEQRQGRLPILDLATYPTYDAVHVLAAAMGEAKSDDPSDVAAELLSLRTEGATGNISFLPDGSMRIPERTYVLAGGRPAG